MPCQDSFPFWNNLSYILFIENPNLVVGGDMNFLFGLSKTWGTLAHVDPLADFFMNKISSMKLIATHLIRSR